MGDRKLIVYLLIAGLYGPLLFIKLSPGVVIMLLPGVELGFNLFIFIVADVYVLLAVLKVILEEVEF